MMSECEFHESLDLDCSDSDSTTYSEYAEDPPSKRHKCTYADCIKSFYRPSKLADHLRRHTEERPFECQYPECSKSYHKKDALKRHEQSFHLQKIENAMCPVSGCMQVMRKNSLRKHILRKHNSVRKYTFYCEECKTGFRTQIELENHFNKHQAIFKCDICKKEFRQGHRYRRHINSHKQYKCICKAEFFDYYVFISHKKICKFCGPYCSICGKRFQNNSGLKQHLKNVHTKDRVPTFKCTFEGCMRSYFHKRNLTAHIREFHQGINLETEYAWICEICQKIFKKEAYLRNHTTKIHINPKPKRARTLRSDKGIPIVPMIVKLTGVALSLKEKREHMNKAMMEKKFDE